MCLGIPAQLVAGDTGHPDLAMIDMGGVSRAINVGLLDDRPGPGDWVLVHMGFALQTMTAQEARDALDALGAEREAADREADALEAAMDAAAQAAAEAMAAEAMAAEAMAAEAMAGEAVTGEAVTGEAVTREAVTREAVTRRTVAGGTAGGIS
jgi:hydrogenase expression/formation protein HypC